MPNAPVTDQEISILCDILEGSDANLLRLNSEKREVLDQLIAKGFVVEHAPPNKYCLTSKAHHLLDERGVGVSGG